MREFSGKAKRAHDRYERAMVQKYGEDRATWPSYDSDVWYSSDIDDQNAHGDNYGFDALGTTRHMFRHGGSSSTRSPSSQSYSSMPDASNLTDADIDRISSRVYDRMTSRFAAQITGEIMPQLTEQISLALRAAQGDSSSHPASPPPPQDDEDHDNDDDEEQWSDAGGDGTA